jgi:NDP-sugar pyrophosphorylase family protein
MTYSVLESVSRAKADSFIVAMPDTYFLGGSASYGNFLETVSEQRGEFFDLGVWKIRDEQIGKLGQVRVEPSTGRVVSAEDKNPSCDFEHAWGCMAFSTSIAERFMRPEMPNTGYALAPALENNTVVMAHEFSGRYFDCGTPSEYWDLMRSLGPSTLDDEI